MTAAEPALRTLRLRIDLVDHAMRRLLRLRQRLVARVAEHKSTRALELVDSEREQRMQAQASAHAERIGLGAQPAQELLALAVNHCRDALNASPAQASAAWPAGRFAERALRLVPPPARCAPLLRLLPPGMLAAASAKLFSQALTKPLAAGELEPIAGRRLAIEATDIGLRWVIEVSGDAIRVLDAKDTAEATIRGGATDLLRLASRIEDADTLFFQRRLQLTGDVELGLTARNLLDRQPWESLPLAMRIPLHRMARLASAARAAAARPSRA